MEFSYENTIIENTENIPLNLEPKQNALFQALRIIIVRQPLSMTTDSLLFFIQRH